MKELVERDVVRLDIHSVPPWLCELLTTARENQGYGLQNLEKGRMGGGMVK